MPFKPFSGGPSAAIRGCPLPNLSEAAQEDVGSCCSRHLHVMSCCSECCFTTCQQPVDLKHIHCQHGTCFHPSLAHIYHSRAFPCQPECKLTDWQSLPMLTVARRALGMPHSNLECHTRLFASSEARLAMWQAWILLTLDGSEAADPGKNRTTVTERSYYQSTLYMTLYSTLHRSVQSVEACNVLHDSHVHTCRVRCLWSR